ncbi:MAG: hypothetical protein F4Z50_11700 [Gemmatimonadetes bacterium]|nr:hypothetical protein [Gemmatimonadota bacterium]
MMAGQTSFQNQIPFLSGALAVLVAGCADARSAAPKMIGIDSDQVRWQSPAGAFWGIADVLEKDDAIWVLSPVEPFIHGLRSGTEMTAFGSEGDGPGELRSARALLPLGEVGEITIWDAASRLYRTFADDGLPVATRDAGQVGTVRGDIDVVTFGDPLRVAATGKSGTVRAQFPSAVMRASDLWTGALVRFGHGPTERIVDFRDLRGASHEDVRRNFLVPVPLWDACLDGSVVVLDPLARFIYRVDSTWAERDSLFVPWDVRPLGRDDRINYIASQMEAELRGQSVESGERETILARAETGSRDQFPEAVPLAVDMRCSDGRVWIQAYDGAAHPLGFSRTWRTVAFASNASTYSEVILPPAFQLFRVSDSHFLGVVTDEMGLQRVATIPLPESLRSPNETWDGRRPAAIAALEGRVTLGVSADGSAPGH